jgi:hypothetical protein
MQTTSPATVNRPLHLSHPHPESWPLLHRRRNRLLPHHAYRVPNSVLSPRYMILLGKGKATLFSGRAIGSRSSRRPKAQMIGGRASCVVSEAAFLRITVNSKTDADTRNWNERELLFGKELAKGESRLLQSTGLFKTEKLRLGSPKRGIGRHARH